MALLDHVGIRVSDLDRAIAFYRDMFGFELLERRLLNNPRERVDSAAMKIGAESVLFLLHNPEAEPFPPHVQGRPDHFCLTFEPDEFPQVMSRLEAAGVFDRLDCALQPRTGATGRSDSKYILDPDNNQVEIKLRTTVAASTNGASATAGTR
jgi:catechol 2,3-dioxygenase-like lactoylglutathione lyase family enzyme